MKVDDMGEFVNTVPAENQMINAQDVSFLGRKEASLKILIVGNSITRHGPKAEIGWYYDWGMAASAPENDYVHRLYAMLTAQGRDVCMYVRQAAYWERNFKDPACLSAFEAERAFSADVVIFRLGENVAEADVPFFAPAIRDFVRFLCPDEGRLIFTTCFWKHPGRDDAIRSVAESLHFPCADIACTEERMMAIGQFEHKGVAGHPSDFGMEMIAKQIFAYI